MIYVGVLCLFGLVSAVGLIWWELNRLFDAVDRYLDANPKPDDRRRILELEGLVDLLPVKWEAMVLAASRHERRARSVVRSAEKKLAEQGFEDPALEAEGDELQRLDAEGGEEPELRLLPGDMDTDAPPAQPQVEDWRTVTMRKKYGGS